MKKLGIEPDSAADRDAAQELHQARRPPAQQMLKLMEALEDHDDTQERLVELRRRPEGDRGLAGVRVFGIDPGSVAHRLRLCRDRRLPPPSGDLRRPSRRRRRACRSGSKRSTTACCNLIVAPGPTASPSKTSFTRGTCAARWCSGTPAASPCSPPFAPVCRSSNTRPRK